MRDHRQRCFPPGVSRLRRAGTPGRWRRPDLIRVCPAANSHASSLPSRRAAHAPGRHHSPSMARSLSRRGTRAKRPGWPYRPRSITPRQTPARGTLFATCSGRPNDEPRRASASPAWGTMGEAFGCHLACARTAARRRPPSDPPSPASVKCGQQPMIAGSARLSLRTQQQRDRARRRCRNESCRGDGRAMMAAIG